MAKYKYRIESARLKGWDYRNPGIYFITICIHERRRLLGECKDGRMQLSAIGAMIQGFWFEIPKHFDHVRLGEFVVMPNHIHGENDSTTILSGMTHPLKELATILLTIQRNGTKTDSMTIPQIQTPNKHQSCTPPALKSPTSISATASSGYSPTASAWNTPAT